MPNTPPPAVAGSEGSANKRPVSARRMAQQSARQQERSEKEAATAPEQVNFAADALLSFQSIDDEASHSRMSHKQVEQHRRLKAKQYFEDLRAMLPNVDARSDRNKVLAVAIDHMKDLQGVAIAPGSRACERAGLRPDADDEEMMFEMDDAQKMSHNVVEQRRRHLAKGYFDELRALLTHPQASKFDKNTVLQHTVVLLKRLQSRQGDAYESEGQQQQESHSGFGSDEADSLSHSPNDVTAFATSFALAPKPSSNAKRDAGGEARKSRKRHPEVVQHSSPSGSDQDIFEMEVEEQEHKRTRRGCLNEGGAEGPEDCECEHCDQERACFAALSLLSEVALSVPNTPIITHGRMSPKDMGTLELSA